MNSKPTPADYDEAIKALMSSKMPADALALTLNALRKERAKAIKRLESLTK